MAPPAPPDPTAIRSPPPRPPPGRAGACVWRGAFFRRELTIFVRQVLCLDEPLLLTVELDEHRVAPQLDNDDVELLSDAERAAARRRTLGAPRIPLEQRSERFAFGLVRHGRVPSRTSS